MKVVAVLKTVLLCYAGLLAVVFIYVVIRNLNIEKLSSRIFRKRQGSNEETN